MLRRWTSRNEKDSLFYSECNTCGSEVADYKQTKWNKLMSSLQKAENRLLYFDQLCPLVRSDKEGFMKKISFEDMSKYAILWMEQEGGLNEQTKDN